MKDTIKKVYYAVKPLIPRSAQIVMRRKLVNSQRKLYEDVWPIDESADGKPDDWNGWPDGKKFALVLTHDVDTRKGQDNCRELSQLEKNLGFRSSFNFVPERYEVSLELMNHLRSEGFEIGVHGLKHDGKLYKNEKVFRERAQKINDYIEKWGCVGFRSPAMHHNLDWINCLNIKYDLSTFDTDPFEPQSDGVKKIFPFSVKDEKSGKGYIEMPYTLVQDFTLFILMQENNKIWKDKLERLAQEGAMVLLNTHPDYMNFSGKKNGIEQYSSDLYSDFLKHVSERYQENYWHVLPEDMADFWINRNKSPEQKTL